MDYQLTEAAGGRRRIIRIVLFLIILSTMPFYCAGFLLWGTAGTSGRGTPTPFGSNTPIGGDTTATVRPTITPLNLTVTISSPLQPTPLQFLPGFGGSNPGSGGNNTVPTAFIQPTAFIPPTSTLAPTLTPYPTNPPPPTSTPPPLPTDPPLPTNTPEPLPTDPPLPTDEPPPTVEELAPPVEGGGAEVTP